MATNRISKSNSLACVDKNIFSGPPESVVKEGVWIKVQPHTEESVAVRNAVFEQKRMDEIIFKKQQRLHQFHQNVQRRVAEKLKAQQRLVSNTETENVKIEQKIIYQSIAKLQNSKRKCIMYNANPLIIDGSRKLRPKSGQEKNLTKEQTMLSKQSTKIKEIHSKALETLLKRQLKIQAQEDEEKGFDGIERNLLPGGLWGTSTTRDMSAVRSTCHSKLCSKAQMIESNTPQAITVPHDVPHVVEQEEIVSKLHKQNLQMKNSSAQSNVEKSDEKMEDVKGQDQADCLIQDFQRNQAVSCSAPNFLRYKSGKNKEWKEQQVLHKELHSSNVKKFMVTRMGNNSQLVRPSLVEHKRRKMNQRVQLICRRVFSDMEREKVRQERKRREHKSKVEQLRVEKEVERMKKESDHDKNVAMATTKPDHKMLGKEIEKREHLLKKQERMQNHKRNLRYAFALKAQVKQRLKAITIDPPSLCCCSPSFWDTDPFTCANNCVFYKNIEAYTIALHSVLLSIERNTRSLQEKSHSVISLSVGDD